VIDPFCRRGESNILKMPDQSKIENKSRQEYNNSKLMAWVLAGAWRRIPPALEISAEELAGIIPVFLETGAGALVWRLVRNSNLRTSPAALQLQQAYRLHAVQAALHEREIQEVVELLRSNDVEPVLVKGWAIARLYDEPGLRPYGDIDLCVDPDQYLTAKALLEDEVYRKYRVDLHKGVVRLGNQPWGELYSRSRCLEIDGVRVRTLGPEDHLRLLCFHFLREGAWRPLWLCDVAVALEARPTDFDWDLCLGTTLRSRDCVAYTLALAQHLLKANVEGVPATACAKQLPTWLLPSVLKEWEVRSVYERHRSPFTFARRRPIHTLRRIRCHWPSPVEATISLRARFDEKPRLLFQIGTCFWRTLNFLLHFPRAVRW
jgi:hypothetical protein